MSLWKFSLWHIFHFDLQLHLQTFITFWWIPLIRPQHKRTHSLSDGVVDLCETKLYSRMKQNNTKWDTNALDILHLYHNGKVKTNLNLEITSKSAESKIFQINESSVRDKQQENKVEYKEVFPALRVVTWTEINWGQVALHSWEMHFDCDLDVCGKVSYRAEC